MVCCYIVAICYVYFGIISDGGTTRYTTTEGAAAAPRDVASYHALADACAERGDLEGVQKWISQIQARHNVRLVRTWKRREKNEKKIREYRND